MVLGLAGWVLPLLFDRWISLPSRWSDATCFVRYAPRFISRALLCCIQRKVLRFVEFQVSLIFHSLTLTDQFAHVLSLFVFTLGFCFSRIYFNFFYGFVQFRVCFASSGFEVLFLTVAALVLVTNLIWLIKVLDGFMCLLKFHCFDNRDFVLGHNIFQSKLIATVLLWIWGDCDGRLWGRERLCFSFLWLISFVCILGWL